MTNITCWWMLCPLCGASHLFYWKEELSDLRVPPGQLLPTPCVNMPACGRQPAVGARDLSRSKTLVMQSVGGSINHSFANNSLRRRRKKKTVAQKAAGLMIWCMGPAGSKLIYWCERKERRTNKVAGGSNYESGHSAVCEHKYWKHH